MNIEPLEARIAPAVLINPANAKIATYTDVDGDKVTITISAGAFNDALIAGGGAIVARIAAIQIGVVVTGTAAANDHFGFVAEQIASFKSLGFTAPLTGGKDIIELSPATADVTIREI